MSRVASPPHAALKALADRKQTRCSLAPFTSFTGGLVLRILSASFPPAPQRHYRPSATTPVAHHKHYTSSARAYNNKGLSNTVSHSMDTSSPVTQLRKELSLLLRAAGYLIQEHARKQPRRATSLPYMYIQAMPCRAMSHGVPPTPVQCRP
jgi:hypothetical protein